MKRFLQDTQGFGYASSYKVGIKRVSAYEKVETVPQVVLDVLQDGGGTV